MATRRKFLQGTAAASAGFLGLRHMLNGTATALAVGGGEGGYGPLVKDPFGAIDLPEGFRYRVISKLGERMDDGFFVPGQHDGMGAFSGPDGKTILVRNHEVQYPNHPPRLGPFGWNNELAGKLDPSMAYDNCHGKVPCLGGTTTVVFDTKTQRIEKHFLSLAGTHYNCAGGITPWGTWITCEEGPVSAGGVYELDHGYNFEVKPSTEIGLAKPEPLRAMGRFRHEAVCVDPTTNIIYQTEDRDDGLFYRFIPNQPGRLLAGGRLQALAVRDKASCDTRNWLDADRKIKDRIPVGAVMDVEWLDMEEIEAPKEDLRKRGFAAGAARFARLEGAWWGRQSAYFACTTGGFTQRGQIWRYVPSRFEGTPEENRFPGRLELFLEPNDSNLINNADNLTVAPWGDLFICEDSGGEDMMKRVTPEGLITNFAANKLSNEEFAGACFSPDGSTLFVNVQGDGVTFAITGPWRDNA